MSLSNSHPVLIPILKNNHSINHSINHSLVGGIPTPWKNKKYLCQIGSSSQLLGKIKAMFETTSQPSFPLHRLAQIMSPRLPLAWR